MHLGSQGIIAWSHGMENTTQIPLMLCYGESKSQHKMVATVIWRNLNYCLLALNKLCCQVKLVALSYLILIVFWLRFKLFIRPVWLNGWVFVYKLSGCGFESPCCHSAESFWPLEELPDLLGIIFLDSKIAGNLTLGHTKLTNVINYGL